MKSDWWPKLLQFIPKEDLWAEAKVPVARLFTIENERYHPGEFRSFTALVPAADLSAVLSLPRGLEHEVSASGPRPWGGAAPTYDPSFWVRAHNLPAKRYEPLILSWRSNDQTVLVPDPRFLMTYGLVPRTLSKGKIAFDDPQAPAFDVVEVDPPSVWDFPKRTSSSARISRDHLQDYLTLRGMALFEVFYAIVTGEPDQESLDQLGGRENVDFEFDDRTVNLIHSVERGAQSITAQVWGARFIAGPNDLPITADPLETTGLVWPGYAAAINSREATRLGIADYIYVDDRVLAPYEGKNGFSINPETGSVSFGNQWSVGFCDRVGRNTIRLELKKLYEGAPPTAIRSWHAHVVNPTPAILSPAARSDRNIGMRAKELVLSWSSIGTSLGALAGSLGAADCSSTKFVKLDRAQLDYYGWCSPSSVEPITRHVSLDMDQSEFLLRCIALNNLLTESLGEAAFRMVLSRLRVPEKDYKALRGLKLLNEVVSLAQVARAAGLSLSQDAEQVRQELKSNGTDPARPLENLFALYDLRIVGSHTSSDPARELENRLSRFGIEPGDYVGGFGTSLDRIYDDLARELATVADTLAATC
ncbi:hypothetical protein [Rhizobium laguerreae]|uniref:hypothetical protein n=1 Tax=Rhizobium laguerreae TaxID=1076926 RepID=UPI001C91753E|nr:hypothetical protein [Rhizobium laguerreae]MBY3212279.1 hypothetical protein [Rhizobium laguerreae]